MNLFVHTESGDQAENEDFVIARRHPLSFDAYICLLADGQGGHAHGAIAAKTACETAWHLASQRSTAMLFDPHGWVDILQKADCRVAETGGFTTLVGVAVNPHQIVGAAAGDSKVYLKHPRDSHLTDLTGRQRKNPPVGSGCADFVSFNSRDVKGGRVLIVSDGAWKYCSDQALTASFATSLDAVGPHLRAAIAKGNRQLPDDLSVIAIDIA